ncbi:MAG: hypothetical protein AUI83_19965 [Armatimonadetes bacterium 13_1_40CM_3_65_7]|nr:MAG: hypothetical protein AUI83_19965 [Armatimonadetes bacterium 13_1_40CM_3_65_7]
MVAVLFALAFIVTIPGPPAVGQVGFKSTTILQSQTTVTGQPIEFPLFRNQFTGILLELAPGGETGVHLHPFPLAVIVLEGTVTVEMEGHPPGVFNAGQAFVETTMKALLVFAGEEGKAPLVWRAGATPVGLKATPVIQTKTTVIGQPIAFPLWGKDQLSVVAIEITPGGQAGRHQHPVPTFVYVLEGTGFTVEVEGHGQRVYSAGQAYAESMNTWHNAFNRGTGLAKVLVVFAGEDGVPNSIRP